MIRSTLDVTDLPAASSIEVSDSMHDAVRCRYIAVDDTTRSIQRHRR